MKNQNRSDYTIKATDKALTLISKNADLNQPETVKQFIANKTVTNGTKRNYCIAYNKYCEYYKIDRARLDFLHIKKEDFADDISIKSANQSAL